MSWNVNHFKRELFYFRNCVGEALDNWRYFTTDPTTSLWDKVVNASDVAMEIVCDFYEAFHYTLGHITVYGAIAWTFYSIFT